MQNVNLLTSVKKLKINLSSDFGCLQLFPSFKVHKSRDSVPRKKWPSIFLSNKLKILGLFNKCFKASMLKAKRNLHFISCRILVPSLGTFPKQIYDSERFWFFYYSSLFLSLFFLSIISGTPLPLNFHWLLSYT